MTKKILLISLLIQACEAPPVCDTQKNVCYYAPVYVNVSEEKKQDDSFGFFLGFWMGIMLSSSATK